MKIAKKGFKTKYEIATEIFQKKRKTEKIIWKKQIKEYI